MQYLWLLCSYLIGSIPFGLLIARATCGIDPRKGGSGNVGATNVARLCGFKWGVATLALDAAKGALSVAVMAYVLEEPPLLVGAAGLCAILGHLHSVFLRFRGGKAVATTVGIFLTIAPLELVISAVVCILAIWISGFVSLGSLVLVVMLPVTLFFLGDTQYVAPAIVIMCLVFFSHRANIKRLLKGEEKSWQKKKNEVPK